MKFWGRASGPGKVYEGQVTDTRFELRRIRQDASGRQTYWFLLPTVLRGRFLPRGAGTNVDLDIGVSKTYERCMFVVIAGEAFTGSLFMLAGVAAFFDDGAATPWGMLGGGIALLILAGVVSLGERAKARYFIAKDREAVSQVFGTAP